MKTVTPLLPISDTEAQGSEHPLNVNDPSSQPPGLLLFISNLTASRDIVNKSATVYARATPQEIIVNA